MLIPGGLPRYREIFEGVPGLRDGDAVAGAVELVEVLRDLGAKRSCHELGEGFPLPIEEFLQAADRLGPVIDFRVATTG
ncbi:MAG: hypothetical protein FJ275_12620, partial [Planctomycetes bacterium]|nr:hypothetical protein [Planctomycetota bacterium]